MLIRSWGATRTGEFCYRSGLRSPTILMCQRVAGSANVAAEFFVVIRTGWPVTEIGTLLFVPERACVRHPMLFQVLRFFYDLVGSRSYAVVLREVYPLN